VVLFHVLISPTGAHYIPRTFKFETEMTSIDVIATTIHSTAQYCTTSIDVITTWLSNVNSTGLGTKRSLSQYQNAYHWLLSPSFMSSTVKHHVSSPTPLPITCCSVHSRCYATIVKWSVISDPFLGNGSVNMFPRRRLRMQWGKRGVVYAVRTEDL
jgi:hypothetical protein